MEFIKKDEIFLLHPKKDIGKVSFTGDEYSSKDFCLSKEELLQYLKNKNFFQESVL